MSSGSSSTISAYYKTQRPEIPGRSESYDPVEMIPGAYPEDRHTTYPSISHPKEQTTPKLKDELHRVQDEVTTVKQELPILSKTSSDVVPLESFGDTEISDTPFTLPSALQDEYYSFAMAHDVDDDPLDLSEVVYADSFAERRGEKRSLEVRDFERDLASDRARGGYVPGDGSMAVDRSYEGDIADGYDGVTYHRLGRGGILPGYPTREGMSKLFIDRMIVDQLRLAGEVDNSTSSSVPAAISRSNSSEGYPTNLPSFRKIGTQGLGSGSGKEIGNERTVPCLDFRILEERRDMSDRPGIFEITPKSATSRNVPATISKPTDISGIYCSLSESTENDRGFYDIGSPCCQKKVGQFVVEQ